MVVERLFPKDRARPTRAYTPAVGAGDWLYVSGQVPVTPDGSIVLGSTADQTRQVFQNIAACLEEAGGAVLDVVSMTVYLTDVADIDEIDAVVREVFPDGEFPSRTTLGVAALARSDFRVEISVVALRGASQDVHGS